MGKMLNTAAMAGMAKHAASSTFESARARMGTAGSQPGTTAGRTLQRFLQGMAIGGAVAGGTAIMAHNDPKVAKTVSQVKEGLTTAVGNIGRSISGYVPEPAPSSGVPGVTDQPGAEAQAQDEGPSR